jgi:hypothetical protein
MSLYDSIFAGMTVCLIMTTLCLVFAVPLQEFAALLKIISKNLTIHVSEMCQKLVKLQQKPTIY